MGKNVYVGKDAPTFLDQAEACHFAVLLQSPECLLDVVGDFISSPNGIGCRAYRWPGSRMRAEAATAAGGAQELEEVIPPSNHSPTEHSWYG